MISKSNLGAKGEEMAVFFLQGLGYEIIERNWRYRRSEIDIIAREAQTLVFVEVKTRQTTQFGLPEESVSVSKMNAVTRAALEYLRQHPCPRIRFDVIAIRLHPQAEPEIFHIRDAFY